MKHTLVARCRGISPVPGEESEEYEGLAYSVTRVARSETHVHPKQEFEHEGCAHASLQGTSGPHRGESGPSGPG